MEDTLAVKQRVWLEPVDETLQRRSYDEERPEPFPAKGAQVWVRFANGRSGPATFHANAAGQFSCLNAPYGALANQKPTGIGTSGWNSNIAQVDVEE